jgi:O-antigen ligase
METVRAKLSAVLWILLLVVLGVASTCSLRWVSPALHVESSFGPSRDLSYALILGLMILIIGALNPNKYKTHWSLFLKICLGLVGFGVLLSTFLATDKSLALYSGAGLLIGLVLMVTTWRLADRPWKIQLALIVVTALGVTFAAKAWIRETREIDQTWQQYEQTRTEFWAKQGKSLDDPTVKMFEARMKSRDNGGFFFHGNLGGMYLATVFFVSLALLAKRIGERKLPFGLPWLIAALLLTLFILSALILTMSKGAILATILTCFILTVLWSFKSRLIRHFRAAVIGTGLLLALAAAAIVGHGLAHKSLPTLSMAYRWQYWVASYAMFKDHPLAGVGLANYSHYYQKYKLPQAEEEITSPHNYIVQGFTELGILGGLGFMLLPLALFYQIAIPQSIIQNPKSKIQNSDAPPVKGSKTPHSVQPDKTLSAPLAFLATTLGIFGLLFLFNQSGLPGFIYLLAEYIPYILIFSGVFVLCALKADQFDTLDNTPPTPAMTLLLTGALITFILGDLVNFSLEEPSTQFLFFFLAGLTLAAVHGPAQPEKKGVRSLFSSLAFLVGILMYIVVLFVPAFRAENTAIRAERSSPVSDPAYDGTYQNFAELANRYSYDAHLAAQAGKRLIQVAQAASQPKLLAEAADWFALAANRAPGVWEFRSQQGQCYLMMAGAEPDKKFTYLADAENAFGEARALAPRSKSLALTLGLIYAQHLKALPSDKKIERENIADLARKNLTEALALDRALPPTSIRHLGQSQLQEIQTALNSINP